MLVCNPIMEVRDLVWQLVRHKEERPLCPSLVLAKVLPAESGFEFTLHI